MVVGWAGDKPPAVAHHFFLLFAVSLFTVGSNPVIDDLLGISINLLAFYDKFCNLIPAIYSVINSEW